jgi:hypothetical protein
MLAKSAPYLGAMPTTKARPSNFKLFRRLFAEAAQEVYDAWQQDEDGHDDEVGAGGICDRIAEEAVSALSGAGFDAFTYSEEGLPNHTWVIVEEDGEHWNLDIPWQSYEECNGMYDFSKIEDVEFGPEDVQVWEALPEQIESEEFSFA